MGPKDSIPTNKDTLQYEAIAGQYSKSVRGTFDANKYKKMLRNWIPFSDEPDVILDVGCGEGTVTDFLKDEFPTAGRIVGIDASEEMIAIARGSYAGIDFRVEKMENLPLGNDEADFVFSRLAIHYSKDLEQTLGEIARVTKPNGFFFMKDTHPFYATFLKRSLDYNKKEDIIFRTQCDDGIEVVHPTFTFEEYVQAFAKSGWMLMSVHEQYGRGMPGATTEPYKIPTSVSFVLKKHSALFNPIHIGL